MRLGGPIFDDTPDPDLWIAALRNSGYRAAYWPGGADWPSDLNRAYREAALRADIVIAEVGAWSNPIAPDEAARREAIAHCRRQLALADEVGARCCVNIAGSRGEIWDGPHPANFDSDTFDLIVQTVRKIIDDVRPQRTFYTIETMPWIFPDSPESYLRLIRAIDRPQFAAHLDPVNLVSSPERYYRNGQLIRECFALLGPYIKCCHAKDIVLRPKLTVHLEEVRPGLGALEYRSFLGQLSRLDRDTPLLLEHLPNPPEYEAAAHHIRAVAHEMELPL